MVVKSSTLLGVGREVEKKGKSFTYPHERGKNIKKGVIHFVQLPGGGDTRRSAVIRNFPSRTLFPDSHFGLFADWNKRLLDREAAGVGAAPRP